MGTLGLGWGLTAAAGLLAGLGVLALVLLLRSARARRALLDAELARSRADVEALDERVRELSEEVTRARRTAQQAVSRLDARADRDFVITSLGAAEDRRVPTPVVAADRRQVGSLVEDRLVAALGRHSGESQRSTKVATAAVRVVALAHGVRRALSADVLDRAAAESRVARRQSRRTRRREVREARRVVRAVRQQDVA